MAVEHLDSYLDRRPFPLNSELEQPGAALCAESSPAPSLPSLSIITVVFNGAATIRHCLRSVAEQGVPVEHIIVDGGSTDGTLELIERAPAPALRVIHGPDRGIYDAMNKGIRSATGDVIGILNADDVYARSDVLEKVRKVFADGSVDSSYGDLVYVDGKDPDRVVRYWRSGGYREPRFYRGWMPPHPTFFVRRTVYERLGLFNLALGSAADYELMLRFLLRHRISTAYIPEVLVRMRTGGASNGSLSKRVAANRMDRRAWRVNGLEPYPWTTFLKPLLKLPQFLVSLRT